MEGKGDVEDNCSEYLPARQTTRIFLSLNSAMSFLDSMWMISGLDTALKGLL